MAVCNENVIKNMASEITRNCQGQNVTVDPEFLIYMIELLLLNPKYGKLFSKAINRNNLAYFVDECGSIVMRGGTALNILKMQFILQTNYDKLDILVEKHLDTIENCLSPLVNEILDMDPDINDTPNFNKLFRKISIYFILASGLGNPGLVITLKEGIAALESVFGMEDLQLFVALPRIEKLQQLEELLGYTSGVRLFNRDCKKGGGGIPELPYNLVEAAKACSFQLSSSLIIIMQKVNTLTTVIEGAITVQDETGNVVIDVTKNEGVTIEDYKEIFDLLAFNRQYEMFIRQLLSDVESLTSKAYEYVDRTKAVLLELHAAVKYKSAVRIQNVYPLFTKLWEVWRAMQNCMFLVSTVNRLMAIMTSIQELTVMPRNVIEKMRRGRSIASDQSRINMRPTVDERLCLAALPNYICYRSSTELDDKKEAEFLGFCVLCLSVGALVPNSTRMGVIKANGRFYGFCCVKMAARFSKEPDRYINEVLHHARNNPHLINLLNIKDDVFSVKDIGELVVIRLPKIKVFDKAIQTETHRLDEYKEKNYSWNLWEWKKRACQWANIVNCQTHATQTNYSHLRSEIQCQTTEPRDKCLQTNKDKGINTVNPKHFLWGLRALRSYGFHIMDLTPRHAMLGMQAQPMNACALACIGERETQTEETLQECPEDGQPIKEFYSPEQEKQ